MKLAAILAGAACVWDDWHALLELAGGTWPGIVIAVNDAGWACGREPYPESYAGRIDHWMTLEPKKLAAWTRWRKKNGGNTDYLTWSYRTEPYVNVAVNDHWGGSSSGFATHTALTRLRMDRVALCGVPLTPTEHFNRPRAWTPADHFLEQWEAKAGILRPRVRSMSGRTRDLLGAPDPEWLGVEVAA